MSLEKQAKSGKIRQQKGIFDMEYTSNYQLPVWAETDRILRTDFNDAYQKLDAALAALTAADGTLESAIASGGNARIVHGTYVGTGASRQGNECTLTFELPPLLVVVCPHTQYSPEGMDRLVMVRGTPWAFSITNSQNTQCTLTWSGNTLSWYARNDYIQCNRAGETYYYVALMSTAITQ